MAETRSEISSQDSSITLNHLEGKYLTFKLGVEEYGLEIMKVQEIIGMMPITKVPRVPDYVRGVINLRGRIIPTIELRKKFQMETVEDTEKTCIIVVEVVFAKGKVNVGIIVDEVAEVLDVAAGEIDSAPEFGTSLHTDFILGVAVVKGEVKILLDINKVLTTQEIGTMHTLAKTQGQGEV
ncbi:MAG: chemotaxis protein CheW [Deltaproteobacteria bacterium]|nr:chemotaxis protein CheW [Deltaproteobacteria bacterium]